MSEDLIAQCPAQLGWTLLRQFRHRKASEGMTSHAG
jgi:hypothetical protein